MLAKDVLYEIFSYLSIGKCAHLRQVCKQWKSVVEDYHKTQTTLVVQLLKKTNRDKLSSYIKKHLQGLLKIDMRESRIQYFLPVETRRRIKILLGVETPISFKNLGNLEELGIMLREDNLSGFYSTACGLTSSSRLVNIHTIHIDVTEAFINIFYVNQILIQFHAVKTLYFNVHSSGCYAISTVFYHCTLLPNLETLIVSYIGQLSSSAYSETRKYGIPDIELVQTLSNSKKTTFTYFINRQKNTDASVL